MLKTGQVFNNRYKIISILGQGGFGAVYKVWDDNLQRYCAIKENLHLENNFVMGEFSWKYMIPAQ